MAKDARTASVLSFISTPQLAPRSPPDIVFQLSAIFIPSIGIVGSVFINVFLDNPHISVHIAYYQYGIKISQLL